jgi:hypothetical protein
MRKTLFMGVLILTLVLMVSMNVVAKKPLKQTEPAKRIAGTLSYCLEVDIDMPSEAYLGDAITISASILNCSDVGGLIELHFEFYKDDLSFQIGPIPAHIWLAAGDEFSKSLQIVLPEAPILAGTYTLHVAASFGDASDEDTATITLLMP